MEEHLSIYNQLSNDPSPKKTSPMEPISTSIPSAKSSLKKAKDVVRVI
jgi:hypothetical protein